MGTRESRDGKVEHGRLHTISVKAHRCGNETAGKKAGQVSGADSNKQTWATWAGKTNLGGECMECQDPRPIPRYPLPPKRQMCRRASLELPLPLPEKRSSTAKIKQTNIARLTPSRAGAFRAPHFFARSPVARLHAGTRDPRTLTCNAGVSLANLSPTADSEAGDPDADAVSGAELPRLERGAGTPDCCFSSERQAWNSRTKLASDDLYMGLMALSEEVVR